MCANAATSTGRVPAAKPAKLPSSTVQPHNFNGCSQGCQFPALHPFGSLVLTHIQHQRHQLYAQHCFLGLVLVGFCITLVGHHFGQQASCFTPLTLHIHPTETCLFFFPQYPFKNSASNSCLLSHSLSVTKNLLFPLKPAGVTSLMGQLLSPYIHRVDDGKFGDRKTSSSEK